MEKALYDTGFFVVLRKTRDRAEADQTLVLKGALYCTVLVFFCIALVNAMVKSKSKEERFIWLICFSGISLKLKAIQKLKQKQWGGMQSAGVFPNSCSAKFFVQPSTFCLAVELPAVGWTLLHESSNKNVAYRHASGPI